MARKSNRNNPTAQDFKALGCICSPGVGCTCGKGKLGSLKGCGCKKGKLGCTCNGLGCHCLKGCGCDGLGGCTCGSSLGLFSPDFPWLLIGGGAALAAFLMFKK